MKKTIILIHLLALFFLACRTHAQSSLTIYGQAIWNNVRITNNLGPQRLISGTAWGYGPNINYTFRPNYLIRNKHFALNIGGGYFTQRFNLVRPFFYNSQVQYSITQIIIHMILSMEFLAFPMIVLL